MNDIKNKWPQSPNEVRAPNKKMPEFKQYYPSIGDMNSKQLKFYKYWTKEWGKGTPIEANLSYIFTYIYEILELAILQKDKLYEILIELNALKNCYPERIGYYISNWITDLFEFHKYYEKALECDFSPALYHL